MDAKLFNKISEGLARAAELRKQANATNDPIWKGELLELESRWLDIVESYRVVSDSDRFLKDVYARRPARKGGIKPIGILPPGDPFKTAASFAGLLDVLVGTAVEQTNGKARAAFYMADASGTELRHIVGMSKAYAQYVDGFAIGPHSLACGLAVATGQPVITPDVTEEPRWKQWLWLAEQFDYRACWSFPLAGYSGKIMGSFAMYYQKPREATPRDLDLAGVLTRTAAGIIGRH